jgi:4-amino-4-deoxy-L-arabinose transferase-like glycosyltransferase
MPERPDKAVNDGRCARWRVAWVLPLAAVTYLLGNGAVSLWDRDEPRYAQSSRQMLRSGDWVVPRLYDEPRTAKPPLIYWLQAASMSALGDNAFAARLPSAVAMVLTLAVFGGSARRIAGPRRASWAVLVLASSVMVLISAKASTTDGVLLLWLTIGQVCLYAIWRGRGTWGAWLVLGAATGLAGLTKGPPAIGVHATTLLALWLLARTLPPGARPRRAGPRGTVSNVLKATAAVAVVAAVSAPWLYLIEQRSPGFVRTALVHDVLRRAAQPLEGHQGPPGYHVAAIWPFFLPWSLLLPLALVLAWKQRRLPPLRFALAASLGPWVMFELVRTKLPHYMLPAYPWLALLVGDAIVRCLRGQHRDLATRAFAVGLTALAVVLAFAAVAPLGASLWFGESPLPGLVLAAAGLAYVGVVYVQLLGRQRYAAGLAAMGLGAMAVWGVAWTVYLPRAQFLRVSVRVADVLRRDGATGRGLMLDYKEPSLAFYQGGSIREHPESRLTAEQLDSGTPWFVVTTNVWDRTAPDVRDRLEVVDRVKGLAYAGARVVEVMVVRANGAQARSPSDPSTRPSRALAE